MASGNVAVWIGKGDVIPWAAKTLLRAGLMPKSSKDTSSLFIHETERVRGANRNFRLEEKDSQGRGLILTQEANAVA